MVLGFILGLIGLGRIVAWQKFGFFDYGPYWFLVAVTVATALIGIVTFIPGLAPIGCSCNHLR
jgi:magnesium transporter